MVASGQLLVAERLVLRVETMWLETLMALISEQFDDADEICVVDASVSQRQDKLSLWTKKAVNEATWVLLILFSITMFCLLDPCDAISIVNTLLVFVLPVLSM
ncbi:putative translation Initiation factor eIF-4e [Helianthus debilis subsp. tardiflorus]